MTRCTICQKKLKLVELEMKCKCGIHACTKHRFPSEHACTYDFLSEKRTHLKASLPVVKTAKVPAI